MAKRFLQIALNIPLNQTFTYLDIESEETSSRVGLRADVKFGNRRMTGFIVGESNELPQDCPVDESKIRPILRLLDEKAIFTDELLDLALFVSKYYLCSLGEAISSMLPGGKREVDAGGFSFAQDTPETTARKLSDEQRTAVESILSDDSSSQGSKLHYLYGPTGSGKTEVFLQTSESLLKQGKGVIYLVPEIGLTSQVIEAVISRFGNTAAVLHSGLTPSKRLSEWRRIMNRDARVVIGARSAVFAPVPDLGMIIIDEEHDSSYKSGNTPRYHARQVAMYRCSKNGIPLLMGSATPSVEAWKLMQDRKIIRHTLTKRLAGGAMPEISCINLSDYPQANGAISPKLEEAINETLREKRQTILFLNRRGFTHFFRCNSCGYELKCKNCSVSLTYHKNEKRLRCHYCGYSVAPPQQCPECGSVDVGYSGFGTEFIENEVKAKFPNARITRIDTDNITHKGEFQEKIDAFKKGDFDILLGTQMVAKGLNFPNLKLVGIILADTSLHLPDFRAAERTFSLITQVAGRAGRFFPDGKVLVQTYCPDAEPVTYAVHGKTELFYESEIATREMLDFPPFTRLLRIVFRSQVENQAVQAGSEAASLFSRLLSKIVSEYPKLKDDASQTEILGPVDCPLSKIAANYRQQIILRGPSVRVLLYMAQSFQANFQQKSGVYIEYDVDPVNLL